MNSSVSGAYVNDEQQLHFEKLPNKNPGQFLLNNKQNCVNEEWSEKYNLTFDQIAEPGLMPSISYPVCNGVQFF